MFQLGWFRKSVLVILIVALIATLPLPFLASFYPLLPARISAASQQSAEGLAEQLSGGQMTSSDSVFDSDVISVTVGTENHATRALQSGPLALYLPLIVTQGSDATFGLEPIGDQTVSLGSTLRLALSASGGNSDERTFGVSPLPLPDNASFNAMTGVFTFSPASEQRGTLEFTFSVTDGKQTDSESVTISVPEPNPNDETALQGRILDANDATEGITTPLEGATVTHIESGMSTTTDADGYFTLTGLPAGASHFDYDARTVEPAGTYGAYRSEKGLIPNVTNILDRPIYIMAIDTSGEVDVDPNNTTVVNNPNIDTTVTIPPHTVMDEDGNEFDGMISISPVPAGFTPGSLPDTLVPDQVITVQPMGLTFDTPAPVTFPNTSGLSAGSEVDIWSMDHSTSEFFVAGIGRVTDDGTMIETIEGGIREASWHFPLPPGSNGDGSTNDGGSSGSSGNSGGSSCPLNSTFTLHNGCLGTTVSLPSYLSLGESRNLELAYKSASAYPQPIIPFQSVIQRRAAVPPLVSYELTMGGVAQGEATFIDTSGLSESQDEPLRMSTSFDGSEVSTGVYPHRIRLTSHYGESEVASNINGRTMLVNEQESAFGAGWGLAGLQRLYVQSDGSAMVTNGDGAALRFAPDLQPLVKSTFDTDDEGWRTFGDAQGNSDVPDYVATGGNPGGYISATDNGENVSWYWKAPTEFLGDFSVAYEGTLTFDLKQSSTSNPYNSGDIILTGGGLTLIFNTPYNPDTEWTAYTVPLNEYAGWTKEGTDEAPTQTEMQSVLSSLTQLLIRGEYRVGADTGDLDNVAINAISMDATTFQAPEGDFSTLTRNDDGTFTRRMKDGIEYHFNASGYQTSMVDRNGNTTTYAYDANNRLISITDPASLVTTLTYSGNHLSSVSDPTGRETSFEHDANGNLVRVTYPDSSQQSFGYDSRHLMTSETDRRGFATMREYDQWGRLTSATMPDDSVRQATYSQSVGLVDPDSGLGSEENPAPVIRPEEAVSTLTDGEGRTTTYNIGPLGRFSGITDPAGFTSTIERNEDGNPTQTTTPSGAIFANTYDERGNQLTFTDETVGGTTEFTYENTFNQVTSISDSFDEVTNIDYDEMGNPIQISTPLLRSFTFEYDNRGLLTNLTDPLGTASAFSYDSQGNLTQVVQGTGAAQRSAALDYTDEGYVEAITDPSGREFDFAYDALGRLTSETLPANRTISYEYDSDGNLTSLTPPSRPAHTFEYNEQGLMTAYIPPAVTRSGSTQTTYEYNKAQELTKITRPNGKELTYTYDNAGRLTTFTVPRGPISYGYSKDTGQLTTANAPDGINLTYDYLGELLTDVTWSGPIAGSVTRTYDANYRTTSLTTGGNTINFQYDADNALTQAGNLNLTYDETTGLLTSTDLGNVSDNLTYNQFAELESYSATYNSNDLYSTSYTRDKLGRITELSETIDGTTVTYTYTYDSAGRLAQVERNDTTIATYTYDANGNRLTFTSPSGTTNGTYDDQDRLLTYGNNTYTYTANGELTSKSANGQTITYNYDVLGNLMSVTLPDSTQIEYLVDSENRRIGKKVDGTLVAGWLYQDALNPIAELDANGNITTRFVYASQSNVPDYMTKNGTTYRIISDHLGSPRLVINTQTGDIAQQMDYDAFGNVTQDTNPGFQPFGFAGGLYDTDTELVRFGARDYDAETGRWTAKDPIGFDGGDANLYGYVGNDPVNFVDLEGFSSSSSGRFFGGGGVNVSLDINQLFRDLACLFGKEQFCPSPPPQQCKPNEQPNKDSTQPDESSTPQSKPSPPTSNPNFEVIVY